ncbi:MAG: MiaB/RimO family radical SAM methylthiotransferase [Oscillospiraceae bacterium]|nr:MiaB/RimO family radical SAM methylthiotransferase [Oscillospiraceae bacterium]
MKRVHIHTLGCRVNQYESVAIAEALEKRGMTVCKDGEAPCDFYILNTCAVTGEAERQSRQLARRFASRGKTAVLGCASQNAKEEFLSIPGVFYVGGCSGKLDVVDALLSAAGAPADGVRAVGRTYEELSIDGRSDLFSVCRAYIKIQDGCSGHCTYCVIPSLRGPSRSRPAEDVVAEAERLVRAGCREVVLTGIETSAYNAVPLQELLVRLGALEPLGLARVRLGSLSPGTLREDFLRVCAEVGNFMPHVHLSLQSGADRVLRLMRRPYTAGEVLERIKLLRSYLPRVLISADFITGFPTETEEEALATEAFLREANLFHVHAFPYSERAGTPAAVMEGQLPVEVRKARCARLNAAANEGRERILDGFSGKSVRVLVERCRNGFANGHTEEFLECVFPAEGVQVGDICTVTVTGRSDGRLQGKVC